MINWMWQWKFSGFQWCHWWFHENPAKSWFTNFGTFWNIARRYQTLPIIWNNLEVSGTIGDFSACPEYFPRTVVPSGTPRLFQIKISSFRKLATPSKNLDAMTKPPGCRIRILTLRNAKFWKFQKIKKSKMLFFHVWASGLGLDVLGAKDIRNDFFGSKSL